MDSYITKTMRLIEEATDGLSELELTASHDGKWSPAQVLEHLAIAYGSSAKAFEMQLQTAEPPALRPLTFKDRAGIFLVCTIGYFPEGRKAPERTLPSDSPQGLATVQRALENLERANNALAGCEHRWGKGALIFTHPILGPLSVAQWRKFHFVHTRHHMKQVRERAAENRAKAMTKSA